MTIDDTIEEQKGMLKRYNWSKIAGNIGFVSGATLYVTGIITNNFELRENAWDIMTISAAYCFGAKHAEKIYKKHK